MENANALAPARAAHLRRPLAFKSFPLERLYRDSRCGSVMLPWTAEICLDRIGRESLYEPDEKDD